MRKKRRKRLSGLRLDMGKGGAEAPPAGGSTKSVHLRIGRLAVEGMAGVFDRPIEWLPRLTDNLLVGCDGPFGRHAKRVGLDAHVGGELAFALCGTVIANRAIEILIAGIIGGLGRGVARFGDGSTVELPRSMGGSDISSDDALEVDLHRPLAKAF